jgi:hypothetical protein
VCRNATASAEQRLGGVVNTIVANTVPGRSATVNWVTPKWHHSFMVIVPGIEVV